MSEKAIIKRSFPHLKAAGSFQLTSAITNRYNCIAWAAGDEYQWWWPIPGKFWPAGVERVVSVDAFVAAFATMGYARCDNGDFERGFEKIVVYLDAQGEPTHAARQLEDGQWTSKLGDKWDISHKLPVGLEGSQYGSVGFFMRRPI